MNGPWNRVGIQRAKCVVSPIVAVILGVFFKRKADQIKCVALK